MPYNDGWNDVPTHNDGWVDVAPKANPFDKFKAPVNPFDKFKAPAPPKGIQPRTAEPARIFTSSQQGNQRDVMGVASPAGRQSAEKAKQWLNAPTEAPKGIVDFATRVVPHSAAKALKGTFQAPVEMAGRVADPMIDAAADYAYGDKGGGQALAEGTAGAAKGIAQNVGDIAKFFGTKAGVIAPDAAGNLNPSLNPLTVAPRVWHEASTDPVGTGLAAFGAKGMVKAAAKTAAEAASRVGVEGSAELANLSKTHDVPLTAGEASGSAGLKSLETQLERVPVVGTRGFREMQSSKLADAANNLVERFAPENMTDIPDQIQTSMLKTLQEGKDVINRIQGRIDREVAQNVTEPILPGNLRGATVKLLDQFPDIFDRLPSTTLKSKLEALAEGTASKTESVGVLDAQGSPIKRTVEPTMGFKDAMNLRELLNDYLSRAYKSAGAVGNREIYQLSELKRGLDADINTWGETSSNSKVVDLFKQRNAEYIKKVVPFKEATVKNATGSAFDTDLMLKKFIQPDRPQLARKLMGALDEEGQGLVRYAVLKKALDAGQDAKPGVPFSPAKFAREIERLGPTIEAVFPGADKQLIQGFSKLSRVAERAGQYAESPPTGLRAADTGISLGIGAGAVAHPLLTAGGLGTAKALSSLLTTELGKKILLKASGAPETSSRWAGILDEVNQLLPGLAAGVVGSDAGTSDDPPPVKQTGESPVAYKSRLAEWERRKP